MHIIYQPYIVSLIFLTTMNSFLGMFLIMLFGIIGNASIIFIILKNKLLRLQPTNLFLLNMAVSDFINLCICPILYIFKRDILFVNYYLPKWCCIATPYLTGISKNEYFTDRNNLVKLAIQVTQFLDLLFESTLMLVLSTESKTELNNWK